ncbi:M28 family peptidase [Phenylobacterium sp.]|uniref:M28 family metallopeptidase n=1 Tax=Phenylobacterium sp. TaxID=1871053 RepID=UPI0025E2155A|nr:M28 family peptidase [Phenylobacterium sp.]
MKSLLSLVAALAVAVAPAASSVAATPKVCAECVRANMAHLASAEMRGRSCGTADENAAARFVADQLKAARARGAGEGGAYLQPVEFRLPTYAAPPTLEVGGQRMVQGGEILTLEPAPLAEGPLVVVGLADPAAAAGRVAVYDAPYDPKAVDTFFRAGAVAVIVPAPESVVKLWVQLAERGPGGVEVMGAETPGARPPPRTVVFARPETMVALHGLEGQAARVAAPRGAPGVRTTYNVLGVIHGTAPDADTQAVLLTAHYDHVGVRGGVVYPGANDDASGTAAVLEFARILGAGKAPKRTVQFALFGCEEEGGHGAKYFLAHPSTPLTDLVANLEFEMIGVPDPADRKALMLTGWERSTLGPALKAHGASIHPDAYPQENFFQRSDNYQLARKGVVAQTISAWPIPPTYHQPSDDLAHVDLPFMAEVVQSLVGPIGWLLNSDFRPEWNPGMKP